jgi:hypothetical protein
MRYQRLRIARTFCWRHSLHALFTAACRLECGRPPASSPFSASSSLEAGRLKVCPRALVGLFAYESWTPCVPGVVGDMESIGCCVVFRPWVAALLAPISQIYRCESRKSGRRGIKIAWALDRQLWIAWAQFFAVDYTRPDPTVLRDLVEFLMETAVEMLARTNCTCLVSTC